MSRVLVARVGEGTVADLREENVPAAALRRLTAASG